MKKIQFDLVSGVEEVLEFDYDSEFLDVISQKDVFYYLRYCKDVVYACEVDMDTFARIDEEYGIKKR